MHLHEFCDTPGRLHDPSAANLGFERLQEDAACLAFSFMHVQWTFEAIWLVVSDRQNITYLLAFIGTKSWVTPSCDNNFNRQPFATMLKLNVHYFIMLEFCLNQQCKLQCCNIQEHAQLHFISVLEPINHFVSKEINVKNEDSKWRRRTSLILHALTALPNIHNHH